MAKKVAVGETLHIKQKNLDIFINQDRPEFTELIVIERLLAGLFLRFQKLDRKKLDIMMNRLNRYYQGVLQDEAKKRESKADQS